MKILTSLSANPLLLRRAAYLGVIVFCVAATLALVSAHDRAAALARDAAVQSAWQTSGVSTATPATPEAVYSRFNIKAAAANADLAWQAATATELRASLRALDAAQIKLAQVKITRSGTGFLVSAERAP